MAQQKPFKIKIIHLIYQLLIKKNVLKSPPFAKNKNILKHLIKYTLL